MQVFSFLEFDVPPSKPTPLFQSSSGTEVLNLPLKTQAS